MIENILASVLVIGGIIGGCLVISTSLLMRDEPPSIDEEELAPQDDIRHEQAKGE